MDTAILFDIGIIIVISTIIGYAVRFFRQPLIPAYILTGIILGPFVLGVINDMDFIKTLAEIGVAFLLFVVGLELEIKRLKTVGLIAIAGGTIQVFLFGFFGFLTGTVLGMEALHATYIGIMIAFSSTMVVIKMLSDRKELDTLHGRIIVGFLLIQDVFAIFALMALETLNNFSPSVFSFAVLKVFTLLAVTAICSKWVFPKLFKHAAESREMLFLLSVTTCFAFSFLAMYFNLSIAIGAFLAGLALANLPYHYEIVHKVKPLRDFFSILFFVSLGMELVFTNIGKIIVPIIVLTLIVLIVKPIIFILLVSFFGYKKRTAFMTGVPLAQTSEFSLIVLAQGVALGHLTGEAGINTMGILVTIITMIISTYFIQYLQPLYKPLRTHLKILERFGTVNRENDVPEKTEKFDHIILGCDRIGLSILHSLKKQEKSVLVVDNNPEIIRLLNHQKVPCMYGDIADPELLNRINFHSAKIILSTISAGEHNAFLLQKIKDSHSKAMIFVTANHADEALSLYNEGADYVILPHLLGGNHVSVMLEEETFSIENLVKKKLDHINELKHRRSFGHKHG